MKKFLALLLIFTMIFTFAACGGGDATDEQGGEATFSYDDIPDTVESEDGTYQIAMVTDVGNLKDGSFNESTWNGCKWYANENGLTYKYYAPANGDEATDDDRIKAMVDACEAGAEVLVTPGFMQATALSDVAPKYPDVQFVFIDGWDLGLENVIAVSYQEEQAGYLAGYAAVMEGYTSLGYSGGGGGTNPACLNYGYGYVQGANDAAAVKGVDVEMRYTFEYGASFQDSPELQTLLAGWFEAGTEVIFMAGGNIFYSGVAAAEAAEQYIIGVDVDQSPESETVITSAMKGLDASVIKTLTDFYAGGAVMTGASVLGAAHDAVGLPVATWSLENWTVEEYEALFEDIKAGNVEITRTDSPDPADFSFEHVTFVK
ncbi:MAG: BMP family ABC transporter substrate-binding protein [Firmicutes bacterium]|nr:BMP family ABC transporter substrate-binding protein [Bacillota bacterium]